MIRGKAFKIGLPGRSALLGDPQDKASKGAPANWVVGAPGAELDALVIVAGDTRATVNEKAPARCLMSPTRIFSRRMVSR